MSLASLPVKDIQDPYVRKALQRVQDALNANPIFRSDWGFFEITVRQAETNFKYEHNLGFQPKDVVMLSVSDGATVTWNYDNFNVTNVDLTTDKACTIRAFIGRYQDS